jgi:hypothetical protein
MAEKYSIPICGPRAVIAVGFCYKERKWWLCRHWTAQLHEHCRRWLAIHREELPTGCLTLEEFLNTLAAIGGPAIIVGA